MTRGEFLSDLSDLLQDIPAEEREEALQYYMDYFEDAGIENEHQILKELESPQKVAATIKGSVGEEKYKAGEYQETGYSEPRFEDKKSPARSDQEFTKPVDKGNSIAKLIVVGLVAIICVPVIIAIVAVLFSLLISLFALFASIIMVGVALMITGVALIVIGIIRLFIDFPMGIAMLGCGLIIGVIGCIIAVALWKLCKIVLPAVVKLIVDLSRKVFYRKGVAS